jgi:hypothetical protein
MDESFFKMMIFLKVIYGGGSDCNMVSDESAEYNTEKRKNWWKRNNWE